MNEQRRQFLLGMVAYAVNRDVAAEELCGSSGISIALLTKADSGTITEDQQNQLWSNASNLCKDPLFGLHFGESLQLVALGAVGEIIKSSDTIGKAITIAASFTPAVTDLFTMEVDDSDSKLAIAFPRTRSVADELIVKQVVDFLMAFAIHELNGFLLQKIIPRVVKYTYEIEEPKEYVRIFRCAPSTEAMLCEIEFEPELWHQPIITANYELQNLLIQKVKGTRDKSVPVSFQIRILDYLMKNAYLGILSLEDVAGNFNMTPRSLQRRLQEESVTFQQLADSVRKNLALHYMDSGKYQIKEISHILGYNELSAFSRAFKRWTGKTPISYHA